MSHMWRLQDLIGRYAPYPGRLRLYTGLTKIKKTTNDSQVGNVMQYVSTALKTTSIVMYDSKSFPYVLPLSLMAL